MKRFSMKEAETKEKKSNAFIRDLIPKFYFNGLKYTGMAWSLIGLNLSINSFDSDEVSGNKYGITIKLLGTGISIGQGRFIISILGFSIGYKNKLIINADIKNLAGLHGSARLKERKTIIAFSKSAKKYDIKNFHSLYKLDQNNPDRVALFNFCYTRRLCSLWRHASKEISLISQPDFEKQYFEQSLRKMDEALNDGSPLIINKKMHHSFCLPVFTATFSSLKALLAPKSSIGNRVPSTRSSSIVDQRESGITQSGRSSGAAGHRGQPPPSP